MLIGCVGVDAFSSPCRGCRKNRDTRPPTCGWWGVWVSTGVKTPQIQIVTGLGVWVSSGGTTLMCSWSQGWVCGCVVE